MQTDVETLKKIYDMAVMVLVQYGFRALMALLIVAVGWKTGEWTERGVTTLLLEKRHLDVTLSRFLGGVAKVVVLAFAALIALDKLGITISPLVAAVSAMIFGASFAIQAPLSNYAAGLSIIFTRPFVVGDTISVKGYSGIVSEVKLPSTLLSTGDGERITIPNKDIVGEVIVNSKEFKVADGVIGVAYADDPEKAIETVRRAVTGCSDVRQVPPIEVGIRGFGESSVDIEYRYWTPTAERLKVVHRVNLAVYQAVKRAGLHVPFPQREVRVLPAQNGAAAPSKAF